MDDDTRFDLKGPRSRRLLDWPRYVFWLALIIALLLIGLGYRTVRVSQLCLSQQVAALEQEVGRLRTTLAEQKQAAAERAEFRTRWERGRFFSRAIRLPHSGGEARGVSWADYDGDGDLDVLICSRVNHLYRNTRGSFTDITSLAGLSGGTRCASWADYDGDGDLDLFYSTGVLWTNEAGRFENDSSLLPRYLFSNTEGGGWLDANRDGLPDILISDGDAGLHLALNQGTGDERFADADAAWGLGPGRIGAGNGDFLAIADYDGDGFPDLLYNLRGGVLARNVRGERYELASEAGVAYASERPWKFGTAFGDFDNDGDLDLFVPQNGPPFLYLNNGDGTFVNIIIETGDLAMTGVSARSAVWGDLNVDGLLDLVVGYPNGGVRVYLNRGDAKLDDETLASGVQIYRCATGVTGMALADYDDDGDLDLLVTGEQTQSGILVNEWPREKAHRSLRVRLPITEAPGAVVRLYDEEKKLLGLRQLGLVQTFSSQGPPEALFGVRAGKYQVSIQRSNAETVTEPVEVGEEDRLLRVELPALRRAPKDDGRVAPQEEP